MQNRTWNLKLTATDEHPETTIKGISQEEVTDIVRGLMHGPRSNAYEHVRAAVREPRATEKIAA